MRERRQEAGALQEGHSLCATGLGAKDKIPNELISFRNRNDRIQLKMTDSTDRLLDNVSHRWTCYELKGATSEGGTTCMQVSGRRQRASNYYLRRREERIPVSSKK